MRFLVSWKNLPFFFFLFLYLVGKKKEKKKKKKNSATKYEKTGKMSNQKASKLTSLGSGQKGVVRNFKNVGVGFFIVVCLFFK